jgi:hypothetical protein
MAGDESNASNPLIIDFVLLARKLEELGFAYHGGEVIIIAPEDIA